MKPSSSSLSAMRSPRRTPQRCSRSWPTRRTRMVSSPTNPSWTGFAARHKSLYTSSSTQRLTNFASLETSQTAQQSGHLKKTSLKLGGQISRLYQKWKPKEPNDQSWLFISGSFFLKKQSLKIGFQEFWMLEKRNR